MYFSTPDVIKECMASCWPNPCKNGGHCVEQWGSHQCVCVNPWAHSGHNCEIGMQDSLIVCKIKIKKCSVLKKFLHCVNHRLVSREFDLSIVNVVIWFKSHEQALTNQIKFNSIMKSASNMPLAIYNNIMEIALGKLIPAELKTAKRLFCHYNCR